MAVKGWCGMGKKRQKMQATGLGGFGVFVFFLLFVLQPWLAVGQESAPQPSVSRSFLWEVEGKNGSLFLLGSLHFFRRDLYPLAPAMEEAYRASPTVVFETDLDELHGLAAQRRFIRLGSLPAGTTLGKELPAPLSLRLREAVRQRGYPPGAFEKLTPWMAALTLTALEFERLGFDPEAGIDRYFHQRARRDGKIVRGLEPVAAQFALFSGLSREEQEVFLESTLDDLERAQELAGKMEAAWQRGDAELLADLMLGSLAEHTPLADRFLEERNRMWLPALEELLAGGGGVLVVVGAGHLAGPDSVVEILRRRGYEVRQR